jgi:NADH-quinone oxidoreductase subunit E
MKQREDTSPQDALLRNILKKFEPKRENLLPILHYIQKMYAYIPEEAVVHIAEYVGTTPADIYGVITFYGLFSTSLKGKYIVRVCVSPPCVVMDTHVIVETIKKILKIKEGETTPDNLFTLELVSCLGLCDKAPAMMINNDIYGDLTSEKVKDILHSIIEVES